MDRSLVRMIEDRLKALPTTELAAQLAKLDNITLAWTIGAHSTKLGNYAWSTLYNRNPGAGYNSEEVQYVIKAFESGAYTHKLALVRCLTFLQGSGARSLAAQRVYRNCLSRRGLTSDGVHGVVWSNDRDAIPLMREQLTNPRLNETDRDYLKKGIKALEEGNPYLLSDGYRPHPGQWDEDWQRKRPTTR